MKIAVIGDIHSKYEYLLKLIEHAKSNNAELILATGDFTDSFIMKSNRFRYETEYKKDLNKILSILDNSGIPFYFVPGNHDIENIDHPSNIDGKLTEFNGLKFYGIGGAEMNHGFCYEWRKEDLIPPPENIDVLLCHSPPKGLLDHDYGSYTLLDYVTNTKFYACGHIHESGGTKIYKGTFILNAGGLGEPYGSLQIGYIDTDLNQVKHIKL